MFRSSFACILFLVQFAFPYNLLKRVSFATVTDTYRTHQQIACDGEILYLDCPAESKILIQHVLYGRSSSSDAICPEDIIENDRMIGRHGMKCNIKEVHHTVQELCDEKQNCTIVTSPTLIGVSLYDPCPGARKHIQVKYNCHPSTFISATVCLGEKQQMKCKENDKMAILSSSFKNADLDAMYCPLRINFSLETEGSIQMDTEESMH